MTGNRHSANFRRGTFNTLAQNGTSIVSNEVLIVSGNGSDLNKFNALKGRAKRKMITQTMMLNMVDHCDKDGLPERRKSYWNTYYCQSRVYTVNGRLHGKYCKNRYCTLCCSIRKADIINRYLPVLQSWEQPYFVTLTVKAVPGRSLNAVMRKMIETFQTITEKYKKQNQRGKGTKLIGIRSLESNFNPEARTYNPHFHCIVANKQMAEILISEWLERARPGKAKSVAQKMEPVFDNTVALIEVIKYGSKIFTEPDIDKKSREKEKKKKNSTIYAAALCNIFRSMKGLRIFERFGFNLPRDAKQEAAGSKIVKDFYEWNFHPPSTDWLSADTGNPLSNYIVPMDLIALLENSIDIKLE